MIKKCLVCEKKFDGRRDAKTCSVRCRKRLQRTKQTITREAIAAAPPQIIAVAVDERRPNKVIVRNIGNLDSLDIEKKSSRRLLSWQLVGSLIAIMALISLLGFNAWRHSRTGISNLANEQSKTAKVADQNTVNDTNLSLKVDELTKQVNNIPLATTPTSTTVIVNTQTTNTTTGSSNFNGSASDISSGTLTDGRLSADVTLQGNSFNNNGELVQLTSDGKLPALDASNLLNVPGGGGGGGGSCTTGCVLLQATNPGTAQSGNLNITGTAIAGSFSGNGSALTSLSGSNISSGTVADARLSTNVTLQGNTFNGSSELVQLTAGGLLPILNGSNLTNVNATTLNGQSASYYTNAANLSGTFTGNVTGNLTGNVTGNVSGSSGSTTGNAATATALQTPRTINGVNFDGTGNITVTAAAGTLTGSTLNSSITGSSLTSVGTLTNLSVTNPITGSISGSSGSTTGNAATATKLQTARNINGVSFDGSSDITVTAAAGTLTGSTLNSSVTASSLTTVGTLGALSVVGTTGINSSGSATTTIGALSGTDLILQDAQWNITGSGAATFASINGPLTGNVTGNLTGNVTGNVSGSSGSTTGNAATATALQTPRTINGVSFDGTGNITVTAAPTAGSGNYIQNQNSGTQSSSNFHISGVGAADTQFDAPAFDSESGGSGTLTIGGTNATALNIANNDAAHTIALGAGSGTSSSNAQAVTVGSLSASSSTLIQGGTGSTAINLQTGTGGTVTIGTNSAGTGVSYSDPTEDYHGAWTGNSSLTTFTFNPLSSVSANTTVFVIVDDGQSVLVNSVSDNSGGGHSWATSASEQTSGDGRHVTVYRTYTGSTGISTSNTISVQMNTVVNSGISSNVEIWVEQVNGLATSSPLDVGAATSGANTSDPATLSTAALSQNNVLTWEIMRTSQATTGCSSSASWKTTGITGNQQGSCLAWQHITGGSGNTVNGTFTTGFGNGTANWAMVVAAYDVAAASNNNLVINSLTKIIPNADSTTAFQIQNASASTNLFTVNTINGVIGIGAAPSSTGATLQVAGGISATSLDTASAGALTIGSTNATTTIGRAGAALTLQGSNFNVSSAGTVNIASGQTYQINGSDINTAGTLTNVAYLNAASQTFTGVNTFTGSGNGSTVVGTLFKNATNTSTAFQIQTSGNSNVLLADTANSTPRIIIGDNTTLPTTGASLITNIDSPASSLDLNLNTGGTSRKNQITFDLNGTQDYALGVDLTGSGADNFFIYQKSSNSAKLLIDATGNVGIGTGLATTAPAKLSLSASTTSTGGIQLGSDTNPIDFYRTGTSATKLTSSLAIQNTVNSTTGFQVQNAGGSALANADTTNMRVQINSSEATISAPGTPTTALVAAGNLSAATYCYKVTALDANGGESLPSTEGTCRASSGSNKEITVAWTAVTGASGYRIYRGTATGAENVYFPCAAVNSGSFTDTCTSSGTAYTFADLGASSGFSASVPTVASAYTSTNNSNTNLQLQVGGNGTPTGQLYVSGTVPSSANAGGLSTPAAPTVTPTCASTCATTWLYSVTAVNSAGGQTVASYIGSTAVGAATLDGSGNNQNVITWSAVTGAVSYNIYRDSSGGTPSSTGLIGNTTSLTFTDNAVAATSALPSAAISDTFIGGSANPTGVAVAGRYEYVSINGGFKIYDVSNPTNPTYITTVSGLSVSYVSTSSVQGHYLYVLAYTTLNIYNISNPTSPSLVSGSGLSVAGGVVLTGLYVQGSYAYVGTGTTFYVVNIANPTNPVVVGSVSSTISNLFAQGSYVYGTTAGSKTLQIITVANPASPSIANNFGLSNVSISSGPVYVQGRYAYVGLRSSTGTMDIVDISNPTSPSSVSSTAVQAQGSFVTNIYQQGRYVYLINSANWSMDSSMIVYDISNPNTPILVGSTPVDNPNGHQGGMAISGRYLYVASWSINTMQIFDLGGGYIQQLEAGGAEFGTLNVDSNTSLGGDASIQGALQVGQSVQTNGNLGVGGTAFIQGTLAVAGGITGGLNISGLSVPSAPTITNGGTAGSTAYSYEVTAIGANGGETLASSAGSTATGNATLSGPVGSGNYNIITWTPVTGAVSYNVYRTASSGSPAGTGLIGNSTALVFNDTGITATTAVPTVDTTNRLTFGGDSTANLYRTGSGALQTDSALTIIGATTHTGSLTANSTVLFQNSANSSSALLVKDQGGTAVLAVNTTSDLATIANLTVTGTCTGCSGAASSDLQSDYNASSSPATITLANSKDLDFVAQDTATDPNILFNLQCVTSCSTNGRFAVQEAGTDVFKILPNAAGITLGGTGGGALTLTGTAASTWSTTSGALTITAAAASTWSTTAGALTIQSGTGNVIFQAAGSGTTGNVQIGAGNGGAGSSTPDLLVVDDSSATTDPTGVNGAIYYNANGRGGAAVSGSFGGAFRCYQNNAWQDCIGQPNILQRRFGYAVPITTAATALTGVGMTVPAISASCGTATNGAAADSNYIKCTNGATAPKGSGYNDTGSENKTEARYLPKFETKIATDANFTSTGSRFWSGLTSATLLSTAVPTTATANTTVILGIGYETAVGTDFYCVSGDATNISGTDMGVAATASHIYDIIVDYSTSGTLVCSIADDGVVGSFSQGAFHTTTKTTNVPASSNSTALGIESESIMASGTTTRALSIAYLYLEQN